MRMSIAWPLMIVAALCLPAWGQEKPEVAKRFDQITRDYVQQVRSARTTAARTQAQKDQLAALEALIEEAEKVDADAFSADDRLALGRAYQAVRKYDKAVEHLQAVVALDAGKELAYQPLITSLLAAGRLDEAEKTFTNANERFPKSQILGSLHGSLYSQNLQKGRPLEAANHMAAYLDWYRARMGNRLSGTNILPRYADLMIQAYRQANRPDLALDGLDRQIAAMEDSGEAAAATVGEFVRRKLVLMAELGQAEQAETLLETQLTEAKADLEKNPDSAPAVLRVAALLRTQGELAAATKSADPKPAQTAHLTFLAEQLQSHPASQEILGAYVDEHIQAIGELMRSGQVEKSDELMKSVQAALDALDATDPAVARRVTVAKNSLASLARRLESERTRAALIDQPAIWFVPDAWVNGSPTTADDLRGKVVLLDFWAVWCGPCIATFPHLREWNERFADSGLVIIGVTRYYSFGWDADAKRAVRVDGLSPEDERTALVEFARHYELKHRFALMPDGSDLAQKYGVTGIPQAVLIDRAGKVRMIRVGSGDQNAHDLEAMLEKLIDEPAPAAGEQ